MCRLQRRESTNSFDEFYTFNVEITNIVLFNFRGEVIFCGLTFPGSWHDSRLAWMSGLKYPCLEELTPSGYALLSDSGFTIISNKIVRVRNSNETHGTWKSELLRAADHIMQRVLPSELIAAGWEVRLLKAPFGRIRSPLSYDSDKRRRLLEACVHVLYLRTQRVGLNQI